VLYISKYSEILYARRAIPPSSWLPATELYANEEPPVVPCNEYAFGNDAETRITKTTLKKTNAYS